MNSIVSSVSELTAYIVSGALYDKIGPKISFVVSFIIGIIGSIFYITLSASYKSWIPIMVLGSKFGISASFNLVYLANRLFPPVYSSTTFGLCNFVEIRFNTSTYLCRIPSSSSNDYILHYSWYRCRSFSDP